MARGYIVVGLGIGEEGKGATVDFLCKELNAGVVVRYGGGPHSNHYVVREDGLVFCFAQLGAGSFQRRVKTHLARGMIIKPQSLILEIQALEKAGVSHVIERLSIDPHAAIVLPWHAMLSQMRELARGENRHGTVGLGVGIAADDRAELGERMLSFGDLSDGNLLREKLDLHYQRLSDAGEQVLQSCSHPRARVLFEFFRTRSTPHRVFEELREIGGRLVTCELEDTHFYRKAARLDDAVVLEGTHGLLLHREFGFAPHVTKSDVGFSPAEDFFSRAGHQGSRKRVGVLRAYATRHGTGPFVTYDRDMTERLPEPHNVSTEWLERFRVGSFDLLNARYALACCGGVDFISLTNVDRLSHEKEVRVCTAYEFLGSDPFELDPYFIWERVRGRVLIREIKTHRFPPPEGAVARLLKLCRPAEHRTFEGWGTLSRMERESQIPARLREFITYLEGPSALNTPVGVLSYGGSAREKLVRLPL